MNRVLEALALSAAMAWDILWALILGFTLSAVVQAVVSKEEMSRLLPDASPRTLAKASGLGAASSSCSYAAVALARSMFVKGADFTAAMAFQFASTNLVLELGILLWLLLGWRFTLAEFVGGPVMIALLAMLFRALLRPGMVEAAKARAGRGEQGRMEGHAAMDMSIHEGTLARRAFSPKGFTAISHFFVMDWASIWVDIAVGLLISGFLAAFVPNTVWERLFLTGDPRAAFWAGPFIGPVVAVLSFVCSVGNVPLAVVLWHGGISFGGLVSFLFADLVILPILNIYRKYYGFRVSAFLFATFYAAMAAAGLLVEGLFRLLHLLPARPGGGSPIGMTPGLHWNYTTYLNLAFLALAALLLARFFRTGGPAMLHMMGSHGSEHEGHEAAHST